MPRKMVSIHEAAEFLGVVPQTLRRWEREGWVVYETDYGTTRVLAAHGPINDADTLVASTNVLNFNPMGFIGHAVQFTLSNRRYPAERIIAVTASGVVIVKANA